MRAARCSCARSRRAYLNLHVVSTTLDVRRRRLRFERFWRRAAGDNRREARCGDEAAAAVRRRRRRR